MSTREFSFDPKGHTRASTPEDLAEQPYTTRDTRGERGSLRGSITVLAVGAVAVAGLAFNNLTSKNEEPVTPQKIEAPTK